MMLELSKLTMLFLNISPCIPMRKNEVTVSVVSFMNDVKSVIYIASLLLLSACRALDIGVFIKNSRKNGASMRM